MNRVRETVLRHGSAETADCSARSCERTIRIVHVIIDLNRGGAELMMQRLLEAHRFSRRYEHHVISLHSVGQIGRDIADLGITCEALGLKRFTDIPRVLWTLTKSLRRIRPQVVHAWMYHASLFCGLALIANRGPRLIWAIRAAKLDKSMGVARSTLLLRRCCAPLSRFMPDTIVYAGEAARRSHEDIGYARTKGLVIPNGYPPPPDQPPAFPLPTNVRAVIGSVGRFNAAKDPKTFVEAAARVAKVRPGAHFLMVGSGLSPNNGELMSWIDAHSLGSRVTLAGERSDIYGCLAGMDIFCLHSATEAFPNVVAEAMNAGLPCVVTDVGDASAILGDAGLVVPARNPAALAAALIKMIDLRPAQRTAIGNRGRESIARHFSIEAVVSRYEDLYEAAARSPLMVEHVEVHR